MEYMRDQGCSHSTAADFSDYNVMSGVANIPGDNAPIIIDERERDALSIIKTFGKNHRKWTVEESMLVSEFCKDICKRFYKEMDKAGLLNDDVEYDSEHWIETVAIPHIFSDLNNQHKPRPIVVCIVGPSGCGKSTLVEHICKIHPQWGAVASYTTRPMREGEVNGVGHRFVSEADMPDKSEMVAYTKLNGCHYWATRGQMREHEVTLYVVDEAGVVFFRNVNNGEFALRTLYIECENSTVDQERRDRDKERVCLNPDEYDTIMRNDFDAMSLDEFLQDGVMAVEGLVEWLE